MIVLARYVESRRTPSVWLYDINKVPVYSLHMRYIPAYNRYLFLSSTVDQVYVNVIIVIIAGASASDNAVPVC